MIKVKDIVREKSTGEIGEVVSIGKYKRVYINEGKKTKETDIAVVKMHDHNMFIDINDLELVNDKNEEYNKEIEKIKQVIKEAKEEYKKYEEMMITAIKCMKTAKKEIEFAEKLVEYLEK